MRKRNDLELYERNADSWWEPRSAAFRSLRSVGEFHVELIRGEWGEQLRGKRVADLGCGGGFLSLALADLGAHVTGVDISAGSLRAARDEAHRRGSNSAFVCADLRHCPLPSGTFDFVLLSDVLEHLEEPQTAVREGVRLLRPGGRLFANTFDRTRRASFTVVDLAEGLGLVPRGTHDARLFIRPGELEQYAAECGMSLDKLIWERPALLRTVLTWTVHLRQARRGVGFSAFFSKGPL